MPITCIQASTPVKHSTKLSENPELNLSPIPDVGLKEEKGRSECPVTISIEWTDRTKKRVLPPQLSGLGKMLCRGTNKQIARAVWRCEAIKLHLYNEIAKQVNKECIAMCVKGTSKKTKKREASCLRKTDKESIKYFSFDVLANELAERAPLLLLVLKTASFRHHDNNNEKWKSALGVAAAVCLRNRSRNMIALQWIIALINRHSGFLVSIQRFTP